MERQLPVFDMKLMLGKIGSGISKVSLVKRPAIKVMYLTFNDEEDTIPIRFTSDSDRRLLTGPLLIPDQKVYRKMKHKGQDMEFFVRFSKEEIEQIAHHLMRSKNTDKVNVEHGEDVDDVYMVELFYSDKSRGLKAPEAFKDLPDGTLFATYKVDNDTIWNDYIKTGQFLGFSIEGLFQPELAEEPSELDELNSLFAEVCSKLDEAKKAGII